VLGLLTGKANAAIVRGRSGEAELWFDAATAPRPSANPANRKEDSDMLIRNWHKWAAIVACGGMMLQITTCTDAATVITSLATTVTAGGVIYIITRIMD
jgi:hypothetical protein